jgi:hypothetical protein
MFDFSLTYARGPVLCLPVTVLCYDISLVLSQMDPPEDHDSGGADGPPGPTPKVGLEGQFSKNANDMLRLAGLGQQVRSPVES